MVDGISSSGFVQPNEIGVHKKESGSPAGVNSKNTFNGKDVTMLSVSNGSPPHESKINDATKKNFIRAIFSAINNFFKSFSFGSVKVISDNKLQRPIGDGGSGVKSREEMQRYIFELTGNEYMERVERRMESLGDFNEKAADVRAERLRMQDENGGGDVRLENGDSKYARLQPSEITKNTKMDGVSLLEQEKLKKTEEAEIAKDKKELLFVGTKLDSISEE